MRNSNVDVIQLKLSKIFPDNNVLWTNAGFLISVFNTEKTFNEVKSSVLNLLSDDLQELNEIIYRLFVYTKDQDQFKVEATLYTKPSYYEGNMHTSTASSTDAHIFIKEIDYEYLTLMGKSSFSIEAKNAGTNFNMMNSFKYGELFVMGFSYNNCSVKIDSAQKCFISFGNN